MSAEKLVLALDGYDPENLSPIHPDDALWKPGDTVTVEEDHETYGGESGVVQAVGYAGGLYGCIVADVLIDGTSEAERIEQESLA